MTPCTRCGAPIPGEPWITPAGATYHDGCLWATLREASALPSVEALATARTTKARDLRITRKRGVSGDR